MINTKVIGILAAGIGMGVLAGIKVGKNVFDVFKPTEEPEMVPDDVSNDEIIVTVNENKK